MIWLIITQDQLMSIATKTKICYKYQLTNEVYRLFIMNPSRIYELLMQWYPHHAIKTISLALDGSPIIESPGAHKIPAGYITNMQETEQGRYVTSIPGYLIAHYSSIFSHFGISIEALTTCTLLTYAAVQKFERYTTQILIQGCEVYEAF